MKTAYIGLGAGVTPGLHHPDFKLDEDQLITGSKILATIIKERLKNPVYGKTREESM